MLWHECQAAGVYTLANLPARLSGSEWGGEGKVMVVESWPAPWEICSVSLSGQEQALKSVDSFFIWCSPRCGGVQGREGEREIGGGGAGPYGGLVLVVSVSVMNKNAVKQEQTQFEAPSPQGETLGPSTRLHCQTKALTSSVLFLLELTLEQALTKESWRSLQEFLWKKKQA